MQLKPEDLFRRWNRKSSTLPVDFVYGENMEEIKALLNKGKATSAVVMSMSGMKGITLEERAKKAGLTIDNPLNNTI